MRITIESTDVITTFNHQRVRVWKGVTERGISCLVLVATIAVESVANTAQFEQELQEIGAPTELRVIDLRHVL